MQPRDYKGEEKMALRVGAIGKVLTAFVLAFGVLGTQAEALSILTFDQTVDGGTIGYAGGAAPATGSNVAYDILVATGTPLNAGTYGCSGCSLNFTTGANTVNTSLGGGLRSYQWAAGGTFTLTGTVFNPSDLSIIATGTLLVGSFTSASATTQILTGLNNDIINFIGQGTDTKNPDLLAFFGITNDAWNYSNFEGSGAGVVNATTGAYSGPVNEADLINTELTVIVPEPASALLLLLGLGSIAAARIRRRS